MRLKSFYKPEETDFAELTARVLSDIANPLIIPPLTFGVIGLTESLSIIKLSLLLFLSIVFFTVLPIAFALFTANRNGVFTLDFPERRSRISLYIFAILSILSGTFFLVTLYESVFIRFTPLIFLLNLFTSFIINFRWKISIHSTALATGGSYLLLFGLNIPNGSLPMTVGFFLTCIVLPLVGWARYKLNVHSKFEIWGGISLGSTLTIISIFIWM